MSLPNGRGEEPRYRRLLLLFTEEPPLALRGVFSQRKALLQRQIGWHLVFGDLDVLLPRLDIRTKTTVENLDIRIFFKELDRPVLVRLALRMDQLHGPLGCYRIRVFTFRYGNKLLIV